MTESNGNGETTKQTPDDELDQLKLKYVAKLGEGYAALAQAHETLMKIYDMNFETNNFIGREITDDLVHVFSLGVRFGSVRDLLITIHHKSGHLIYDQCWRGITPGDEFTTVLPEGLHKGKVGITPEDFIEQIKQTFGEDVQVLTIEQLQQEAEDDNPKADS